MTEAIHAYLSRLYPGQPEVYNRLMQRLEGQHHAQRTTALFSEKDVILITYADSLQKNGTPPLRVLHQFARAHLAGSISTIHILPFYPYSSDDGFSVIDFYAVKPEHGSWQDIEGIGVDFGLMFDAVFNHMSAQSDWFHRFLEDDPDFRGMFRTESPETDLTSVTRPRATPLLTAFQKTNGETVHVWTTFSDDQVDIDFRDPQTLLRMLDVLLFYVEKGAHIIRLDAIAYLWKTTGTSCIHLEETHVVIWSMRAVLDVVAPHVILITETNVPHAENISYFGDGYNEAQLVYNFTLPPLLLHTLLSGDAAQLTAWVNTLHTPSERTTFFNFTASHDGIGVRPVEGILSEGELTALIEHVIAQGGRVSYKRNTDGTQSPYELNITYVDAIIDSTEPEALQVRRFIVSQAVELALAGVPAVYIHSLLGSHNNIEGMQQTGQNRTINRAKLDTESVVRELDNPQSFRAQIFKAYTRLLNLRIQQKAFHPNAAQRALDVGNAGVFALLRSAESEHILALNNVTNQPQQVDLQNIIGGSADDLISGTTISAQAYLEPYQVCWLKFEGRA